MASSLCKYSVMKIYQDVIADVINNVEDLFTEDGVDGQVLQQLKQTWESRLLASKAVDTQTEAERQAQEKVKELAKQPPKRIVQQHNVGQVPMSNPQHMQQQVPQQQLVTVIDNKLVPIQIKLPVSPGSATPAPVLTVQIPSGALQNNQLQKILTGPMIVTLMGLPTNVASSVLQQQINAAFFQQPANLVPKTLQGDANFDSSDDDEELEAGPSVHPVAKFSLKKVKTDKSNRKRKMDSPGDTTDESEEENLSDDSSIDGDKQEEEMELVEEEPLNTDDDVSDEGQAEIFDVDNVVVCQYDKITRNRNKWKFHMKSGIMNLNGEDYVFEKISGEAEW